MTGRIHKKVMFSLSSVPDQADGCELPEELRRYYLDTMGIQVWNDLNSEPEPMGVRPATTHSPAEIMSDKKPVQKSSAEAQSQPDLSISQWPELQTLVQNCDQCGFKAMRNQPLFGVGNVNADLLIIGEPPNQEEEAQAKPFVGEVGDLLSAMLKAIELQRDEVYITNIIKCHAPDHHKLQSSEIENCHAYLRRQIELIKPKVILTAGAKASQALLNSAESISLLRERQHRFEGIPLIASFHPEYLLKKPSEKRKAWQDLLQVKRLLAE